ncbi:DUF4112 domain-containing protein [Alkanindiges sp. WGS2144]|uniref:DUF4112 domain-containing protein n=1 Tax=Alkanindiges sp. WGS2144 TaxID=3366808 RepID=UPI00374FECF9
MPRQPLTKQQAIELERQLAVYANFMDSLVRIPFTRQGIGADAAIGTIPVVGDLAGLGLTSFAIFKAWQAGVPVHKLTPAIRLALLDVTVGFIPVVGDVMDVFIRPSRRALGIVHTHLHEVHGLQNDDHIVHPFLHRKLEQRQQHSKLWRNPVISWLWLHIPDLIGLLVLVWFAFTTYWLIRFVAGSF